MSRRLHSFRSAGISRSKSEGTLIDLDGQNVSTSKPEKTGQEFDLLIDWSDVFNDHAQTTAKHANPFWNGLSESNPFLDDVVQANTCSKTNVSILKEDPFMLFRDSIKRNSISSSGDELDIDHFLENSPANRSARSKSVSYLDVIDVKEIGAPRIDDQILAPDLEWLQNDREAYKMAWLSHRQLTRSCLDLDVISQSPGWAQTQATDTHIVCKVDHKGGSVQLPNSDITIHVPEGHVGAGEFQDISLKAFLDPPVSLNSNLSTTVSPFLEITLSNSNTVEALLLEMKITAEVKNDPYSQVMTEIATFYSYNKDGPFEKIPYGYTYNNMLQIKLPILSHVTYIVSAAVAKSSQSPATSVYNHIQKSVTVAVYGPKHIHPAFTTVLAVLEHNYTPDKLTVDDIKRRGKNMPPLVFQLWGKHQFVLDPLQDVLVDFDSSDSNFSVKAEDNNNNEIKELQLKTGKTVRTQFSFSLAGGQEVCPFVFSVLVKDSTRSLAISEFTVDTPNPAPKIHVTPQNQTRLQKRKEIMSTPVLPVIHTIKYPQFQDRTLKINNFAVTLKTVLRQQKIDYFLEYFKGDTISLLGEDKVKAIGQTKIKEWYVGVLRGKVGLVHCKNVKIISREQVIDFSDVHFSTKMLLEQIALPFKKFTYIYSSVLSNVSDKVYDWRCLADALGYSHLSLDDLNHTLLEKESDRVAAVVKKLKEDCHADSKKRKFHCELIMGLLKMDCQALVARLTQDTVILTAAVQLGIRWRELAEKLARLTKQQIEAYEIPHQGKTGEVSLQMMWKPAFDFLYTWAAHYGESYRDVLQDLHCALDKMKYPVTRQWRELTGALIFVNCLEIFQMTSFTKSEDEL